jgi:hypothetical protein
LDESDIVQTPDWVPWVAIATPFMKKPPPHMSLWPSY